MRKQLPQKTVGGRVEEEEKEREEVGEEGEEPLVTPSSSPAALLDGEDKITERRRCVQERRELS